MVNLSCLKHRNSRGGGDLDTIGPVKRTDDASWNEFTGRLAAPKKI